jgi:hypothetical protein
VRTEKTLDHDWRGDGSPGPGIPHNLFSARWRGRLAPAQGGDSLLGVRGDGGYRLFVDGKLLIENWSDHAAQTRSVRLRLVAGRS